MKSFKILLLIMVMLSVSTIGCSKTSKDGVAANTSTTTQLKEFEIIENSNKLYETEISEFSFGSEEYTASSGKVLPYKIQGIIGVPKGDGQFPLVLITHGSHDNEDESKRFDTGFKYLVEALSENGYITVSMDLSKAYIWKYGDNDDGEKSVAITEKHLENLKLANGGNNPGYTTNLTNKIDFNKVALIGHSRGGETVFDIANNEISKGQTITSILSIAPTSFNRDRQWPNSSVSILVPEYDGDVVSLDGYDIYNRIKDKTHNLVSVTLLERANHNYFNSNLILNDATLSVKEEYIKDQLSREEQEKFLANFATDFLNATIGNKISGSMYDLSKADPNKMYGLDIKALITKGKATSVADITTISGFTSQGTATTKATQDSWFFKDDKVLIDTITFGTEEYKVKPLVEITWENLNDKITITPKISDFSNDTSLVINTVINSASELNEKYKSQSFSVEIADTTGNKATVVLPENLNSLGYVSGELDMTLIDNLEYKFWTKSSPIGQIRIPLSAFKDVNFKNITSISLIFDKTNTGDIFIESIKLQ